MRVLHSSPWAALPPPSIAWSHRAPRNRRWPAHSEWALNWRPNQRTGWPNPISPRPTWSQKVHAAAALHCVVVSGDGDGDGSCEVVLVSFEVMGVHSNNNHYDDNIEFVQFDRLSLAAWDWFWRTTPRWRWWAPWRWCCGRRARMEGSSASTWRGGTPPTHISRNFGYQWGQTFGYVFTNIGHTLASAHPLATHSSILQSTHSLTTGPSTHILEHHYPHTL